MLKLKKSFDVTTKITSRSNRVEAVDKSGSTVTKPATLQVAMKVTLIVGQMFSLIPVLGVSDVDVSNVRFKWKSLRCFYSILSLMGQLFITIMCSYWMFHSKASLDMASIVIFNGTACITMLTFLQIARQWPKLTQLVASAEAMDPGLGRKLAYKSNSTCAILLSSALFEHILSLLAAVAMLMKCHPDFQNYESFVKFFYPWIFNFLPYNITLGILTQFLHFQSTFIWNFSDLFIICMSYYLTSRLEHINEILRKAHGKNLPSTFWRLVREDYSRVTEIVRRVDGVIGGIVFICFANNLFFVCLQLFHTFDEGIKGTSSCPIRSPNISTPLRGYEQSAYFLFSLVFLISRSIAVSLIASQVHSSSLLPAPLLYDVPAPIFCAEIQRFLDQVHADNIALTGLQFFSVTRGLLLTVAGTIVTYELVLVQFNTSTSNSSIPSLNKTSSTN